MISFPIPRRVCMLSLFAILLAVVSPVPAANDEEDDTHVDRTTDSQGIDAPWTPLQLGVMEGVQLFSAETSVRGLGVGLATLAQGGTTGIAMSPVYTRTNGVAVGFQVSAAHNEVTRPAHGAILISFWNLARRDVSGVSLGGVNVTRRNHNGLQLGAISSFSRGVQNGVQVGGLFVNSERDSNGFQLSGSWSKSGGDMRGVQLGAFSCTVDGDTRGFQAGAIKASTGGVHTGVQMSGVLNLAKDLRGVQAGGLYNEAERFEGLQIAAGHNESGAVGGDASSGFMICAVYNRSRSDVAGGQIAAVNQARGVRGFQFGLYNSSTDLRGVQIGLINIQNGKLRFPLVNVGFGRLASED